MRNETYKARSIVAEARQPKAEVSCRRRDPNEEIEHEGLVTGNDGLFGQLKDLLNGWYQHGELGG